jgi:hypothetical protein
MKLTEMKVSKGSIIICVENIFIDKVHKNDLSDKDVVINPNQVLDTDDFLFVRLWSRNESNLKKIFDRRFSKYKIISDLGINCFIDQEIKLAEYYQQFFNNPYKNQSDLLYLKMLSDWIYFLQSLGKIFKGLNLSSDLKLFDVVLLCNIKNTNHISIGTFEGYAPNNKVGWFYFGGENIEPIDLDSYYLFVIDNLPHNQ